MFLPSGRYGIVTFVFSGTAVPLGAACTIGLRNPLADLDQDDLTTIAVAAQDLHAGLSAAGVNLVLATLKAGPNDSGPFFEQVLNEPGVSGNNAAPPNVALLIKKITALGGRRGRGRMFWPGCEESNIEPSGALVSADHIAKDGVVAQFFSDATAGGLQLVVLHDTEAVPPTTITDLRLDARVATQRDRLRR